MLRLSIVTAGRLERTAPERQLYKDYAARFDRLASRLGFGPLALIEANARGAAAERKALEAAIPRENLRIALDPKGLSLTSEAFAEFLGRLKDQGSVPASFLIGGADGLGALAGTAAHKLSFGAQTWPHLLVRVMLAEQLYRAATILARHPYHRGG